MGQRIVVTITEKGGPTRTEHFDLEEITIGRVDGNDIVLPRGNLTKRHSRVVLRDHKLIIVDLKSTNGTFVNGKRIASPQVLRDNDKVYLGDFTLTFAIDGDGAPSPAPPRPPPPPPEPAPPLTAYRPGALPIITVDHHNAVHRFALVGDEVVLGRAASCDICIDDVSLSRRHASIALRGETFVITDLGSQNGVFVNGARAQGPTVLTTSDAARVGASTVSVGWMAPDAPPPPPPPRAPPTARDIALTAKAVSYAITEALSDAGTASIALEEDARLSIVGGRTTAPHEAVPRAVILSILRALSVPVSDARPVYDGPLPKHPQWRVTAQLLDGAPARARFKRAPALSLDDDIDPLPPD